MQHMVQETCLKNKTVSNIISLSGATIMWRVDDISSDLINFETKQKNLKLLYSIYSTDW